MGKRKGSGYVITTKTGKKGFTKHADRRINDKIPVYLVGGGFMLVEPGSFKINGHLD